MIQLPQSNSSLSLMPDMTALLDVIFILLVFLMLTANVAPQLLELDLPEVAAPATVVSPNAITLGISQAGDFSIDQSRYSQWPRFQQAFEQRIVAARLDGPSSEVPQVLVAADKDVPLQAFVKLAAWLSEQGLSVAEVVVNEE